MLIKSFRIQESSDGLTLVLIEASKFEPIDVNQVAMKRERPEFSDFLTLLITSTFKFLRSLNFDGDLFGGTYYCGVFCHLCRQKIFIGLQKSTHKTLQLFLLAILNPTSVIF